MVKFIAGRVLVAVLFFFVISLVVFPYLNPLIIRDVLWPLKNVSITEEQWLALVDRYHFDEPLIVRYGYWMADFLTGDFGESYKDYSDY